MSGVFTYTTPSFSVASATCIDSNTVRVTLTAVPNAFVPANFSIPTTTVVSAVTDPVDSSSVILSVSPALQVNNYTVTCSGLTAGTPAVAMVAPFNAAFAVITAPSVTVVPSISAPETNPTATTTLRALIAPSLAGNVWTQLIATLGTEEQVAWDQAATVYDQLFLVSAEGKYLDSRASEEGGYLRPELVAFSDDVFRDLVIQLSTRKLTLNAFLRVLEIYYGLDAVRAHVQTTTAQNFVIPDGSQQIFNIDGIGPFTANFSSSDFSDVSAVTAVEAAVALNRQFRLIEATALALPYVDTQTGLIYLAVYTASRGLRGAVESVSGPIPFPTGKHTIQTQARAAYVRTTASGTEVVLPATSIVVTREPTIDCANIQDTATAQILTATFEDIYGLGAAWGSDDRWGDSTPWGEGTKDVLVIGTNGAHGLSVGDWTFVDGLMAPTSSGVGKALNGLFKVIAVPSTSSYVVVWS
jgi:hypothetical protein